MYTFDAEDGKNFVKYKFEGLYENLFAAINTIVTNYHSISIRVQQQWSYKNVNMTEKIRI